MSSAPQVESVLYQVYKDQLNSLLTQGNKMIQNLNTNNSGYDKLCSEIEKNLKESNRTLKQLDLEINLNMGGVSSGNGNLGRTNFRKEYSELKKNIDAMSVNFVKEKEKYITRIKQSELVINFSSSGTGNNNEINNNSSQREILLNRNNSTNEEILINSTGGKLDSCLIELNKIEGTSEEIKRSLNSHIEQMIKIRSNVEEMNNEVDKSNSLMRRLITRGNRNKALISVFSVTLVCMFLLILYSRF
jgi:hypothetical protein